MCLQIRNRSERAPRGPRLPAALQSAWYLRRPFAMLRRCRSLYGDTFAIRFARLGRITVFSRIEDLRQILQASPDVFSTAANPTIFSLAPSGGLFHLQRERYRAAKGVCMQALKTLASTAGRELVQQQTEHLCQQWRGRELDLRTLAGEVGQRTAWKMLYGTQAPAPAWLAACRAFSRGIRFLTPLTTPYRRLLEEMKQVTRRSLDGGECGPVLASLRDQLHGDAGLNADQAMPVILSLGMALLGGIGSALTHVFYHLADNPHLQAPLAASNDADAPIIDGFIQETLRLSPDAPTLVRLAEQTTRVGNVTVPTGSLAGVCLYLAHVNPAYHDDPDEFRPERFLDRARRPQAYLPFGIGVRKCPAATFAPPVLRTVLWSLCKSVEVQPTRKPANAVSMSFVLTRRSRPIPVRLSPR